jgi:tRNA (cmo5U34)-methyltransferase
MTVEQAFNQSAGYYDAWMRKALPGYADIFASAQEIVPFSTEKAIRVIDLGAGTGLFSEFILQRFPKAQFTLIDLAGRMLDVARMRFQAHGEQFKFVEGDIRSLGEYSDADLVISSLAIHHLDDEEKRALFMAVYSALNENGAFINVDQIKGPSLSLQSLYWQTWLNKVRKNGASEEQIQSSIQRRTTYDRDALMTDQLWWLKEAGFASVDVIYKNYFIGVFYAAKV